MIVKELIKILQELPEDKKIIIEEDNWSENEDFGIFIEWDNVIIRR